MFGRTVWGTALSLSLKPAVRLFQCFSTGVVLPHLPEPLALSGGVLDVITGNVVGIQWVEAKDVDKHQHCIEQPPTTEKYPAQNVSHAKVEKP